MMEEREKKRELWRESETDTEMTIVPKLIYLFSAIPIKLPRHFLTELEKNITKIIWKNKRSSISREIVKTNVKEGGLAAPELKLYYKAVVIKTI